MTGNERMEEEKRETRESYKLMAGWRTRGREAMKEKGMRKVSAKERKSEINNNRGIGEHDEVRSG